MCRPCNYEKCTFRFFLGSAAAKVAAPAKVKAGLLTNSPRIFGTEVAKVVLPFKAGEIMNVCIILRIRVAYLSFILTSCFLVQE